jgi:hypothetical protein
MGAVLATVAPSSWALDEVRLGAQLPGSFSSMDDAVAAARKIAQGFKDGSTTKLPFFRTKVGQVHSVAVLSSGRSFTLHQTSGALVDPWDRQEGYLFKRWTQEPGRDVATRTAPGVEALVGWSRIARFDAVSDVAPFRGR